MTINRLPGVTNRKGSRLGALARDQSGQSLILVAMAFVGLLAVIGLAIDLGLVYIERIKLGKACDAAALAAAQDLPFENPAAQRAMQYLEDNGYGPKNTTLDVVGPTDEAALEQWWNSQNGAKVIGTVTINTRDYQNPDKGSSKKATDTADKIKVSGHVNVTMNFMLFIGFKTAPVEASATAENVSNLDIVFVFDYSGSMAFDTRCFGCYERAISTSAGTYQVYPDGTRRPLPFPDWINAAQPEITYGGYRILAQEAEFFANAGWEEHDYHRANYTPGDTYWAMQRRAGSRASGYNSEKGDKRGAFMMLGPHSNQGVTGYPTMAKAKAKAPRLDYAFDIPSTGAWYVWIRAQCGGWEGSSTYTDGCIVHWGADETPIGSTTSSMASHTDYHNMFLSGYSFPWKWVRVGTVNFSTTGAHHINFWGGGVGFKLDKIVITTNPDSTAVSSTDKAPQFIVSTTPNTWNEVKNQAGGTYQSYSDSGYYGGPPDSGNRAYIESIDSKLEYDAATNRCNPQYGALYSYTVGEKTVTCDSRDDELFDDLQPIRFAQEAAKNFVRRMNARYDQIGIVQFSGNAQTVGELSCLLTPSKGTDKMPEGSGVWDFDANEGGPAWEWCYNHISPNSGKPSDDVTHPSIFWKLEQMVPDMSTNTGEGMKFGIETVGSTPGHYGRPNSVKVMILLTDGVPTAVPSGSDTCKSVDLWNENGNGAAGEDGDYGSPKDCVVYYADQADSNSIVVYTIGLGSGADGPLLQYVADRTGGVYYANVQPEQLDYVFQQIANQIFLRLVE